MNNLDCNNQWNEPRGKPRTQFHRRWRGTDQSITEDFSFGVFRINTNGDLLYANNSFLRLLGYSSLKELQSACSEIDSLKNCFSPIRLRKRIEKYHTRNNKFQWCKRNGQLIQLKEFISQVNNDSSAEYIDCIVEDVTEKSILEKIFKDIHSTDSSILKAIPDTIFVVSKEGTVIESKNSYQKLFPSINNIINKTIFDLIPREFSQLFLSKMLVCLETGEEQSLEISMMLSGSIEYFESRVIMRSHDEAVLIFRNISEEKKSELQIKKYSEELHHLNKTKDKFFSIIGHDLRTPLNGLLGYAEILSTEIEYLDKNELKEFSDSILEIAKSTNILLTNLLEWSRIQNGKIIFSVKQFELFPLIQKIERLLRPTAEHKKIELIIDVCDNLYISADENMLQSILLNLLGNAIKFTKTGGKIVLHIKETANDFKFSVIDDGIGISEENMKKLFNADFGFTTPGTAKEKGTGLGLTLCKEFVKMHNGIIWAESNTDCGATFYFTISKQTIK